MGPAVAVGPKSCTSRPWYRAGASAREPFSDELAQVTLMILATDGTPRESTATR
jgi:hypothetical protein